MRAESKRLLEDFLTFQEYHLGEAERHWDLAVKRMKEMPNQMNPRGVWQAEQLEGLATLRVLISERDRIVHELRAFIEKPKPRFINLRKVPKAPKPPRLPKVKNARAAKRTR